MSGAIDKRLRPFVKQLRAIPGVQIVRANSNNPHYVILWHGRMVAGLPTSSSDRRGELNIRAACRRAGIPI